MILKYVLKNFTRRKVRTILMVLSLLVSTGLVVTMSATVETLRQSNVDLIATAVGRYDLAVTRTDISQDSFIDVGDVAARVRAAHPAVEAVYPRFETEVEFTVGGSIGSGRLLALDPDDDVGFVDVVAGDLALGNGQVAVLEETALNFGLGVGDAVDIAYSFPLPREAGREAPAGASQRRSSERFTISAVVRQDGVTDAGVRTGFLADLADVQSWLELPGRAQGLVLLVDQGLYETNNAEVAALRVREVARDVQASLDDSYRVSMNKAAALDGAAEAFLAIQALINIYGLTALGVVGLLVHTLVLTNVQEQRRDMAILRILGSQRNLLFALVIAEVLVIGLIGVSLGVGLGQLLTTYAVVPIIENQLLQQGLNPTLRPELSAGAILPPVISAFVVLLVSSIKPAQEAARTKVMHAINPGVADNIQLDDLAALRERRPNRRMFFIGLGLMLIFGLIAGFEVVDAFGGPALEVTFILLALGLLVLGLGLLFFITTVPFEQLVLAVMRLLFPRVTYFARRNVGRGSQRNTLISLLVLFSGVLPSFLATQLALESANAETSTRLSMGATVDMRIFGVFDPAAGTDYVTPAFVDRELGSVDGLQDLAPLTYPYASRAGDGVGLRSAPVDIVGVAGSLKGVLFADMMEFAAGDAAALDQLLTDSGAVVVSEGLAAHLALGLGDSLVLRGAGLDNDVDMRIVAIVRRLPGIDDMGRSRVTARGGSTVLVGGDSFRSLVTDVDAPPLDANAPMLQRVLANLAPDVDPQVVGATLGERYADRLAYWARFLPVQLENSAREQATIQVFLLVLTIISFTTAVFGVFAVIYVTVYARRLEIGMMKAVGMLRRELTGMLMVEAVTMTLGAALAGIAAGAAMGYVSFLGQRALEQEPVRLAVDTTVMPFIVVLVVLASILGAAFSARRIVRRRAVEILRM